MASLRQLVEAVAATLQANSALVLEDGSGVNFYPFAQEDATLPCVFILPDPDTFADFDMAMGKGTDTYHLTLQVMVPESTPEQAQKDLMALAGGVGPRSIRSAVFAANNQPTTGQAFGLNHTSGYVLKGSGWGGRYKIGQVGAIGALLHMLVATRGTEWTRRTAAWPPRSSRS